ncbi:zinc-dependent metalloprotease [Enemella sp. A6]|uniref:zinc-dependent metalloprotease n=1 Tax=Enemella sp. A6 TaxID=3440152 RepID=UPI003EBA8F1E
MTAMVDWDLAIATGTRLVPAGPKATPDEVARVVERLRTSARTAEQHVREVTQLDAPIGLSPTLVIDRPSWIRANVDTMQMLIGHLTGGPIMAKAGGVETGAALAFLAPRILGQFDPFHPPHGRLLLVAPNVLKVQRELRLDADDFALWVCLHEETHRVQFTHAPWLVDHLRVRVNALLDGFGGLSAVEGMARAARERDGSLINTLIDPEQRELFDEVTALMSLLEGHADVMMDRVGTAVVPTLPRIRRSFDQRRTADRGLIDRLIRRVLGLDAKLRQYQDGAAFCRRVIARIGVDGLNTAFGEPAALPTMDEIQQPSRWLDRIDGRAA